MDRSPQNHRFDDYRSIFQRFFQGCRPSSLNRKEERRHQDTLPNTCQWVRAMRCKFHFRSNQRFVHARSGALQSRWDCGPCPRLYQLWEIWGTNVRGVTYVTKIYKKPLFLFNFEQNIKYISYLRKDLTPYDLFWGRNEGGHYIMKAYSMLKSKRF